MVTDNKLYKVAITVDGNYVHGKYYDTLTQVYYAEEDGGDGCSYISVKPNQNVIPGTDDTVWKRTSRSGRGEKGDKGDPGERGPQGEKGDTGEIDEQQLQEIEAQIAAKQDALVSGTNIKTVGGQSILGGGNIQVGDENAVKFVQQSLSADQKAQARTNIGAQEALVSGSTIKTVNSQSLLGSGDITVQDGQDGVGFETISTPSTADGTALITLTNGDTITLDLNHQHTQYPKYVYCTSQAAYDAITTKENDTLYLILES